MLEHLIERHGASLRGFEPARRDRLLRDAIARVVLAPEELAVELDPNGIQRCTEEAHAARSPQPAPAAAAGASVVPTCPYRALVEDDGRAVRLVVPMRFKRHRSGRRHLVGPEGGELLSFITQDGQSVASGQLVSAIGLGFAWHRELVRTGASIESLARDYGVTDAWVHALLPLTQLSPAVLRQALGGRLGSGTTLANLLLIGREFDWKRQAEHPALISEGGV